MPSECCVNVTIDWSCLSQTPNGATLIFYPINSDEEPIILLTNSSSDTFYLPAGEYSVVVMNETIFNHDNIGFRGLESYDTIEAYVKTVYFSETDELSSRSRVLTRDDVLAVHCVDYLNLVSDGPPEDIIDLNFKPQKIQSLLNFKINVEGVANVDVSHSNGMLDGLSGAINLSTLKKDEAPVVYYFNLTKAVTKQDDLEKGALEASFAYFGVAKKSTNDLRLYFKYNRSSKIFEVERDITVYLSNHVSDIAFDLELEFGTGTEEDPLIVIPSIDTFPQEDDDAGFNAEVNEWGDEEEYDVML